MLQTHLNCIGLGALDKSCPQLSIAECLKYIKLIDVTNIGIDCDQLQPASRLTIYLNIEGMDMRIAQGLCMNAFTFVSQIMIGSLCLLECCGYMNISWNDVHFGRQINPQNRSRANKFMRKFCVLLLQCRAGWQ